MDIEDMIEELELTAGLTEGEEEFLDDIKEKYENYGELTETQEEKLKEIYDERA